ncbi:MAG: DUF5060 domain-containing protein [bacterium]|nr:DUF5060 domain-containing protein [bacterium]
MIRASFFVSLVFILAAPGLAVDVERWGVFEAEFRGPAGGNPFVEVELSAVFTHRDRQIRAPGFYDGDGSYRIRLMPDELGEWTYTTESNRSELSAIPVTLGSVAAKQHADRPSFRSYAKTNHD